MKSNFTLILICIVFSVLSYGCLNDCKNYKPRDDYKAIGQGYLNLVPYSGFDTITFLHNYIDTITFFGTGKKKIVTQENGNLGACGPASIEFNDNYQYNFFSNKLVIW